MNERERITGWTEEIPYPCAARRAESIERIVDAGMPESDSVPQKLWELWRSIGLRGILFGVEDCLLAGLIFMAAVYALALVQVSWRGESLSLVLFGVSPLLYACFYILTVSKEIAAGMYELKMTCRYTLRQITVFRMLLFSVIALTGTALGTVWMRYMVQRMIRSGALQIQEPEYLRLYGIAFSALFFYASAQILTEIRLHSPWTGILMPAVWCLLCAVLFLIGKKAAAFLGMLPAVLVILMMAVSVCLFGYCLGRYYRSEGESVLGLL